MAVLGAAYQIEPHPRTAMDVVEALFRDPMAKPERLESPRPVPQHKRLCAVLPVAAAVAAALAPPRPAEAISPAGLKKLVGATPTTSTPGSC